MASAAQITTDNDLIGAAESPLAQGNPNGQQAADGRTVPVDQGDPDKQWDQGLGPNNEYLEQKRPDLTAVLWQMIRGYYMEGIVGRRHEIRKVKQARLFWQGLQYSLGWDSTAMEWLGLATPNQGLSVNEDKDAVEGGRYQFVTNFYQAFGLSFIALMSQDVPTVNWYPRSAQNDQDITTAKAASDVAELIQENNQPEELLKVISFYLWCDGVVVAHVREVTDGQRYGFHDAPQMELADAKLGPDVYECPWCHEETPAPMNQGMATKTGVMNCPECGAGMSEANFRPAPVGKVPKITAMLKKPNSAELISIHGALECNRPIYVDDPVQDGAYIGLQDEVHEARMRASYPQVADKILSGTPADAEDVYARASRLAIKQGMPTTHPGDALRSLVTRSRYWIEPWAFNSQDVPKEKRADLLKLFPDGCYVCYAGQQYCESRNESKKDHLRVLQPLPGDGQSRPAVGSSLISPQERYNIMSNIAQETYEFGIPPIYADPQVLDFDAIAEQVAEPAAHYPARQKPGQPLANSFFQPAPTVLSADAINYMTALFGEIAQFLTGLFPSIFGGDMMDQKTAAGYAMARDQALGRIGLYWRGIKWFWAEVMGLGVECFRKNRTEDVERVILGADGAYESKVISLADLKGRIQARPEADETFPRLKSQQRGALLGLLGLNDPVVAQALSEPANMGTIKSILGLTDLVIPGEDSRNKMLRQIQELLTAQPMQVPGAVDPASGMPGPPQMLSTMQPGPFDRFAIELEEGVRWVNSPEGLEAKRTNPGGYANVIAYLQTLQKQVQAQQSGTQKPPSESINFKDLPPDGQVQMAKQAGIALSLPAMIQQKVQDKAEKDAQLKIRLGNLQKTKSAEAQA